MSSAHRGARSTMTMRAYVERNATSATDAYGHPGVPVFESLSTTPCRVWSKDRKETNDENKFALIEDIRCAMPIGTDVTELDQIASIRDRLDAIIWAGPLRIDTIQHKHTHIEMKLKRVQSS